MRKGLTLIEILIAMAITSVIVLTVSMIFNTNFKVFNNTSEEKIAYDNLRNIEEFVFRKLNNAEELEILESIPITLDSDYCYVYSKDGAVYYVDESGRTSEITDSSEETFEIIFTKKDKELLKIEKKSTNLSSSNKEVDIDLENLVSGTEIKTTTVTSSNVIKFKVNSKIEDELKIQYFSFRKGENSNTNKWLQSEYVGVIDQDTNTITVEVDEGVNINALVAHAIHDGDEDIVYTQTSSGATGTTTMNFEGTVYAEIVKSTGVNRIYTIIVRVKGMPKLETFYFRGSDNNKDSSKTYISENKNDDIKGYISEETREVFVTINSIGGANRVLIPDFTINGEYITIEGYDGQIKSGDKVEIDFNPNRTFTEVEFATNNMNDPIKIYPTGGSSTVAVLDNEYTPIEPLILTVYAKAVDGVTIRSKTYEVYVSPYAYTVYLTRKKSSSNPNAADLYTPWIDQRNLKVYIPYTGTNSDKFVTRYSGSASLIKRGDNTWSWSSIKYFNFDAKQTNEGVTLAVNENRDDRNQVWLDNNMTTVNVYNRNVYDKVYNVGNSDPNDRNTVGKDDINETDKMYEIIRQHAGIFKFHYENTKYHNKYLYEDKVSAEIIHKPRTTNGNGYSESYIGNGNESQMGEINVTFPRNEYLEEMVATITYMGDNIGLYSNKKGKTTQESDVTVNNIINGDIVEYYVKSEIDNNNYFRYKFNVIESEPPKIELNNNELLKSGTGVNEKLTIQPEHTYIQGINREEKPNSEEYSWYYVSKGNEDRIGTNKGVVLSCTNKVFVIDEQKEEFLGPGYVYGGVRTKSETYEVDGVEYGGVYTDWEYTEYVEVDYGEPLVIKPQFGFFVDKAIDIIWWTYFYDRDKFSMHSNGDITLKVTSMNSTNSLILQYVNSWTNVTDGSNNAPINYGYVEHSKVDTLPMPDYEDYFEKSISICSNNNTLYDAGNKNVVVDLKSGSVDGSNDNLKNWIVGKNIDINLSSDVSSPANIYGIKSNKGTITINGSTNRIIRNLGSESKPVILYQPDGGTINIKANLYDANNYLFIYAPKSTVNIEGGYRYYANTAIIANEINVMYATDYAILNKLETIQLPH